ncbi:glutamate racemase [Halonatronum saccharophilum]|uniref:glutamate racemase n=1 Tax=Halonatronum saccharophilum TaxID=150060 RepID=UPI00048019D9|nr:glutamate racemase [Halonatronum saccharophilum]
MDKNSPIALFDSGVGGLTIAKEIINEFPNEKIIYFGDTAHLPYGPRNQSEVRGFVMDIIEYFHSLKAKMIIIACNTATAAGLREVQEVFDTPIIGPIEPGVGEGVLATKNKRIGVIATEGTIASGAYQNSLKRVGPDLEVFAKACPEFIPLVEEGELYTLKAKKVAQRYLVPLREEGIDTLILGCTHFPYLGKIISEVMGEGVELIYPGKSIALKVKNLLKEENILQENKLEVNNKFYVSDLNRVSQNFVELGKDFLGFKELDFEELDLWSYKAKVNRGETLIQP